MKSESFAKASEYPFVSISTRYFTKEEPLDPPVGHGIPVAAVAGVVGAFVRHKETECSGDEVAPVLEDAGARRAEKRFSFSEGEFDGVEVRTVRRQKANLGAELFGWPHRL
jgi:hypothetical protein